MQKTWVPSLGGEDTLEKEMATHSNILAWENPMDGGTWLATVHGVTKSWTPPSNSHLLSGSTEIIGFRQTRIQILVPLLSDY